MERKYIVALDQGTTSSRAVIFDDKGNLVGIKSKPFRQIYPMPGWVEHDPKEIWEGQYEVLAGVLKENDIPVEEVACLGITNQRETVVVWDRTTGQPVYNAIVWQCRRTAPLCDELKEKGLEGVIKEKTGLVVDAYFSGTKIKWILDNVEGAREKAQAGQLIAGTIDFMACMEPYGRKTPCNRYNKRFPNNAIQHSPMQMGHGFA